MILYRVGGGGGGVGGCQVTLIVFFIFLLVRLRLGYIQKISFLGCLYVPPKFVWVVSLVVVESEFSDRLWLSFSLGLTKPNNFLTSTPMEICRRTRLGGKNCLRVLIKVFAISRNSKHIFFVREEKHKKH